MRATTAVAAVGAFAHTVASASVQAKNFIYVVPDGYGQSSQTMARDLKSLVDSGNPASRPGEIPPLAADELVVGLVRTYAANNLITDSAASGTAFAAGYKSNNGMIGVIPDGRPVGSILEAAKVAGMRTGLVVTSTINHATPAVYAAHTDSRGNLDTIAEHEVGYNHPLGAVVDILLGGGRCSFYPQDHDDSCRSDDLDLWAYAEEQNFTIARNREEFDSLDQGLGGARLPILGLFNDGDLRYEIDRRVTQDEPSLIEMAETALNTLHRATHCKDKGFFIMIEASRIDHAGHANDPAAHAADTLMYNDLLNYLRGWIDEHPDTVMMSAADHECGGLTLNGFNPLPLNGSSHSGEHLQQLWRGRPSSADPRQFLVSELLPLSGVRNPTEAEINTLLSASNVGSELVSLLSSRAGVNWSTGGHTASDITLFAYAASNQINALKADLAGNHENTELPRYIEEVLGLDMDAVTQVLQAAAEEDEAWLGKRGIDVRDEHIHSH
ncbi:putative alkaline phosphatase [Stachybotrys elegans]|uniref:Alkaline phosphatase n=1 Tax=Stachybotrys elegans TaxID=80388 RepID=A0A8K0WX83_9HYPO|nr:putative alkaline phosphatase [Stachybotrys elegans]